MGVKKLLGVYTCIFIAQAAFAVAPDPIHLEVVKSTKRILNQPIGHRGIPLGEILLNAPGSQLSDFSNALTESGCENALSKIDYWSFSEYVLPQLAENPSLKALAAEFLFRLEIVEAALKIRLSDLLGSPHVSQNAGLTRQVVAKLVENGIFRFRRVKGNHRAKFEPLKNQSEQGSLKNLVTVARTEIKTMIDREPNVDLDHSHEPKEFSVGGVYPYINGFLNADHPSLSELKYRHFTETMEKQARQNLERFETRWEFAVNPELQGVLDTENLGGADLRKVTLEGVMVPPNSDWRWANFRAVRFEGIHANYLRMPEKMTDVSFTRGELIGANFRGVTWEGDADYPSKVLMVDLSDLNRGFDGQPLAYKDKPSMVIKNVHFKHVNLERANFDGALLENVTITGNLRGATFRNAQLKNVRFVGDLAGTDFTGAKFEDTTQSSEEDDENTSSDLFLGGDDE